jgi:hypothetical protein
MMRDIMRILCEYFLLGDTFSLSPVLLDRTDGPGSQGKAYAQDLFLSAFASDPMSREVGMRFRRTVLEPGGSQNGMDLLENFLGREPNMLAIYKELSLI